jgi:Tfp pilus assembly protein PilN
MMVERIEINLLPAAYRIHRRTIRLRRSVIYPLLVVVVMGFAAALIMSNLEIQISQLKTDIRRTDDAINKNKAIKNDIAKVRESKLLVEGKIAALEKIDIDRSRWVRLMEIICQKMPELTWLVSCEERDSVLKIEGKTYSLQQVAGLMSGLSETGYVSNVDLSGIEEKDESKIFFFTVTCRLNNDDNHQGGKK